MIPKVLINRLSPSTSTNNSFQILREPISSQLLNFMTIIHTYLPIFFHSENILKHISMRRCKNCSKKKLNCDVLFLPNFSLFSYYTKRFLCINLPLLNHLSKPYPQSHSQLF